MKSFLWQLGHSGPSHTKCIPTVLLCALTAHLVTFNSSSLAVARQYGSFTSNSALSIVSICYYTTFLAVRYTAAHLVLIFRFHVYIWIVFLDRLNIKSDLVLSVRGRWYSSNNWEIVVYVRPTSDKTWFSCMNCATSWRTVNFAHFEPYQIQNFKFQHLP